MNRQIFIPRTWSLTTRLLVPTFVVLVFLIVLFGLASVTGLALAIAAAILLLLGVTHRWRRIRSYVYLFLGGVFGSIVVSGIFMEIAAPLAVRLGGQPALESQAWRVFEGVVSDGILVVGAAATIIGLSGAVILAVGRLWAEFHRPSSP